MAVRIRVLGKLVATSAAGDREIERKAAACVAYLVIEGRQSRCRIADLLWPDVSQRTSRSNLRQLARRLRLAAGGADILTSSDPVEIDPGVEVDVQQLLIRSDTNDWSRVAECSGVLLAGLHFDDCPDLEDWLALTRARLAWTMAHALSVEAARVEAELGGSAALPFLLRWLEVDRFSEEAYRRLMHLYFVSGDRGAALRVYEDCCTALRRQLDLTPSPETVALALEIRGAPAPEVPSTSRRRQCNIPLSVLRPPLLAGRQHAWQQLQLGFDDGKLIMISGPAGIGKTRLVQDFAAARRTRWRYIACRPGDRELPYVHFARAWRYELAMAPESLARVPAWAQKELARLLPDLGEPPPPIVDALQRQRFFEANLALATAGDPNTTVVSDDVHHIDPASHELGIYLGMHFIRTGSPLRSISTFRSDEMVESALRLLHSLFETGQALHVELTPLDEEEICQLLRSLGLPQIAQGADRLHSHTGGIPFYLVETLKALFEDGEPSELPDALTPTQRVRHTIERRLGRLRPTALRLLRSAAVLDERLRVHVALELMDGDASGLGQAWEELERGLLLREGSVAHDFLRSVILETIPEPERALLHERVALALHAAGAHPGRIARHFAAAGQPLRAASCFEEAARLAQDMLRTDEALELRRWASELRSAEASLTPGIRSES